MIRAYVFVEGPTDADLLRRILPPDLLGDVQIVEAGGSAGIPSYARSVLVRRRTPIAVLMDADSLNPDVIEDRRGGTEELIQIAATSIPVKVVTAIPEIEAWLFAAPEAIERILGEKLTEELLFLGKRDPKGVLQILASRGHKVWDTADAISRLEASDIERIRGLPEVSDLIQFLEKMQKDGQAA